jgi:SAM-dependent methyltransferase
MYKNGFSVSAAYSAPRRGSASEYMRELVTESLRPLIPDLSSSTVLDLGCGLGNFLVAESVLSAAKIIGIDRRHEDVQRNPHLNLRVAGNVEKSPLADDSVDAIVSLYVIEHVHDPLAMLTECRRILRPNGTAIFCTPCLFGYKTLLGKWSGHTLSNFIWRRFKGRPHPPWPDYYRANTSGKINQLCAASGFVLERLVFVPELPHFFSKSPLLMASARAWDRFLDAAHLPMFHNCMAYVLRNPPTAKIA